MADSKLYGIYDWIDMSGVTTVTSLSSIPITSQLIKANISASGSLTLSSIPTNNGADICIIINNTGSTSIDVALPSTGNYVNLGNDTIKIGGLNYGIVNIVSDGTKAYIVSKSNEKTTITIYFIYNGTTQIFQGKTGDSIIVPEITVGNNATITWNPSIPDTLSESINGTTYTATISYPDLSVGTNAIDNSDTSRTSYTYSNRTGRLFPFTPTTTATYTFSFNDNGTGGSGIDTYGYLFNSSMTVLTYNDDSAGNYDPLFSYSCTAGTTYYVMITPYSTSSTVNVVGVLTITQS